MEPEAQVGPTCGLVALHMAAVTLCQPHALPRNQTPAGNPLTNGAAPADAGVCSVAQLLECAVARGYSVQGEMFCVDALAALAHECCHLQTKVVQQATPQDVCEILASGRSVLSLNACCKHAYIQGYMHDMCR